MHSNYANKGLTGLVNMGNTCFINTCLQVLSHTYELNDFLNTDNFKKILHNNSESNMLREWNTLRELMWSKNCIIEPGKFIQTIRRIASEKGSVLFTEHAQNDVSEFLVFIIDCFHTDIARPVAMRIHGNTASDTDTLAVKVYDMIKTNFAKDYSEVWNIFYGSHVSEIISTNFRGTVLSQTPEPFFTISLSIPSTYVFPNLYNCFDHYVSGERLVGENGWFNEKTNRKEDVIKRIMFWGFPTILCIDLKRFNAVNTKKQTLVSFPTENLDLRKYVIGYNKESYIYDLYGICNHIGGVQGGHYTGYIKNANGIWYDFNDNHVSQIRDTSKLVSPNAYCLFYRKKTTV